MINVREKNKYEDINLTDNDLFTSVLKRKKACQIVLSIILQKDLKEIHLKEVTVEKVILNEDGKRGIRLDVYVKEGATDNKENDIIYDLEMQRDVNDDLPKRSRFYQSLMDSPILKSGIETKYRNLLHTFIIFITEKDFLGKNLTCYTFKSYCKELRDLELEDGATKIFLNMESQNGDKVLVDMLHYMQNSKLTNSQMQKIDLRIQELDALVHEVKEV